MMTEAIPVMLLALLAGLAAGFIYLALTAADGNAPASAGPPEVPSWQVAELIEEARRITREASDGMG